MLRAGTAGGGASPQLRRLRVGDLIGYPIVTMENQAGVREVKARLSKSEGDVIAELVQAGLIEPAVGVVRGAKPLKARRGASITEAVRDARR